MRNDIKAIILMGVAGSGKTSTGQLLAQRLGWIFRDADSFHPPDNIAKMSAGQPLNDDDRKPWLLAIAEFIEENIEHGRPCVVTCSALKRRYRDALRGSRRDVQIIHLDGDFELIAARMAARKNHFMPTSLLNSQFEALEQPGPDENVWSVSVAPKKEGVVDDIIAKLNSGK